MLITVLLVIYYMFYAYQFFLIGSVFLSWFPNLYNYKIARFVRNVGEWYLRPFLGKIIIGPIDFTPIIGFMVYNFAVSSLYDLILILHI